MIKETLSLTAFILSTEIANEQNIRKLKVMSMTDMLTGVLNRNAMNNRISDFITGERDIKKPFGVFFIDVNGLKMVNDTKGHLAGDNLLKDVASVLKEIGNNENIEIYRVGGDEFMIIAMGTPKDELGKIEDFLMSNSERHSDETDDIRKAMQKADARMYEIKAGYYSRHHEYEWHNKI